MKLKVINSGSEGNCYLLTNCKGETLILEVGESLKKVKEALDFDISNIVGVVVSHTHLDHSKYISEYTKVGINVYSNKQVVNKFGGETHNLKIVNPLTSFSLQGFRILPFEVRHDVDIETYGFLIESDGVRVVFLTDLVYTKYQFSNIHAYLIEANYDIEIVRERFKDNAEHFLKNRVINSHLSIDNCLKLLKSSDLSQTQNIVLLHLSDKNSHAEDFKKRVEKQTYKTVYVADKGLEVELANEPF